MYFEEYHTFQPLLINLASDAIVKPPICVLVLYIRKMMNKSVIVVIHIYTLITPNMAFRSQTTYDAMRKQSQFARKQDNCN